MFWRESLQSIHRFCLLTSPLGLIRPQRLAFAINLMLRPDCELARAMLFLEAVPQQGAGPSSSGRRSSNTLLSAATWVVSSQKSGVSQLGQTAKAQGLGCTKQSSPTRIRAECKTLNTRILPVLEYATQCGNHVQTVIKSIDVFLNTCHRCIFSLSRWRIGWRRYCTDLLKKQWPLITTRPHKSAVACFRN
jgi:hypothetical protein